MKKHIVTLLVMLVILTPQSTHAYASTHKTSVRLNDHTLMFLTQFEFGHLKYDYRLPIHALRGTTADSEVLGFDVVNGSGLRTMEGKTKSIVLSDAKTENGMYVVPKGSKKTFTLVTFLILPEVRSASSTDFAIAVNHLPFMLGSNGVFIKNALTPSELKSYKTAVVGTDWKPK